MNKIILILVAIFISGCNPDNETIPLKDFMGVCDGNLISTLKIGYFSNTLEVTCEHDA